MSATKTKKQHHETKEKAKAMAASAAVASAPLTAAEQLTATEALERVKPRALGLATSAIILPYRLVPAIIVRNIRIGLGKVAPFRAEIPKQLPAIDVSRIDGLFDTGLALSAAAADADKVSSDGEIVRQLQLAREYRARLMPALHALAAAKLVPIKTYNDIMAGNGPRDTAQDCIDLAAAFRKHASTIDGKHAVADTDLDGAAAVGTWLIANLGTRGAHALELVTDPLVDLRNRVGTLVVLDYQVLSIVGHYFLGDGYLEAIPPLRSRRLGRRAASEGTPGPGPVTVPPASPAPEPAPAPAPAAGGSGAASEAPASGPAPSPVIKVAS